MLFAVSCYNSALPEYILKHKRDAWFAISGEAGIYDSCIVLCFSASLCH